MIAFTLRTGALVMAVGAGLLGHVTVVAAQQPKSLVELFKAIPKSPETLEEASVLVDWKGESSSTGTRGGLVAMPAIKAGLAAHEAAVIKIVEAANAKIDARIGMPTSSEQAAKGAAAAAGIDMARMQTDPAYAKEMEAKVKAMSPAELMAMSVAMQEGMGVGATDAREAVDDPPAVKAAADAGKAIMDPAQEGPKRAVYEQRWAEVEKKKAAIIAKYEAKIPQMVLCDTSPNCNAERAKFVDTAMPLVIARETEILKVETAAFEKERAAVTAEVRKAEEMLKAAQYGALSQEPGNPLHILSLDGKSVDQIRSLAVKLEHIAKRAGHVGRCKSDPFAFFYQINACYEEK